MNRNTNGSYDSRQNGNYGANNGTQRRISATTQSRAGSSSGRAQNGGSAASVRRSASQPSRTQQNGRNAAAAKKNTGYSVRKKTASKKKTPRPDSNSGSGDFNDRTGNTAVASLLKAVIYIMSILVISGFLSYFAISAGNDIFAFVKDDIEVAVSIGEDTDIKTLGELLADEGIIKYPKVFNLYAKLRKKDSVTLQAGEYTVSPMMNYDSLIATFAKSNAVERTTVVVTIPEGYTVDQIIDTLVNKYGLSSEKELKEAIENYDFDYWFVKRLDTDKPRSGRKYRLEGYLYPDTYYYYSDSSAAAIIYKMLDNFDDKIKDIFRGDKTVPGNNYIEKVDYLCDQFGMTFDDIVIIASMVQMEGKYTTEYGTISSVFHNRLANPSVTNGKLESDATLQYLLDKHSDNLTEDHKKIDSPYNTYLYDGLPPGSISNPAQTAIIYALYPDNTKYYFFVAGKDGYSLFAKTYKEHLKNIETVNAQE